MYYAVIVSLQIAKGVQNVTVTSAGYIKQVMTQSCCISVDATKTQRDQKQLVTELEQGKNFEV